MNILKTPHPATRFHGHLDHKCRRTSRPRKRVINWREEKGRGTAEWIEAVGQGHRPAHKHRPDKLVAVVISKMALSWRGTVPEFGTIMIGMPDCCGHRNFSLIYTYHETSRATSQSLARAFKEGTRLISLLYNEFVEDRPFRPRDLGRRAGIRLSDLRIRSSQF
jgi:hypothetical protein